MSDLEAQSFDATALTQRFDNGRADTLTLAGNTLVRLTLEPGWRWSESLKGMAGTDSCQTHHIGYAMAGRLGVRSDDGTEREIAAGDAYNIPPGHDGWVIGDETFVGVEFRT